jgi:hypothetical protein
MDNKGVHFIPPYAGRRKWYADLFLDAEVGIHGIYIQKHIEISVKHDSDNV